MGDEDAEHYAGYAEYLAAQRAQRAKEREFIVDCDNWDAWRVFCACSTQWRQAMSGPTGLDYSAVQAVMMMLGIGLDPDVFEAVRYAERGALAAMNKQEVAGLLYG